MKKISTLKLIISTAAFLVLFDNIRFFKNVLDVYPASTGNIAFLGSLAIVLTAVITLLFTLVCHKHTTKPVLITVLLISSLAGYYMNSYNVVIDEDMINNILQTNIHETADLLSINLFLYFVFLGILPSVLVYRTEIEYRPLKSEVMTKLKVIMISLLVIVSTALVFSKFYASFLREHKPLRYYTNPTYFIYSIGRYTAHYFKSGDTLVETIAADVTIPTPYIDRELIILVIGEAARADRFSLNGYERETNPLLAKEDIINFPDMHSCGTSTAVSVPCMFSVFGKDNYSAKKATSTQNILDILSRAGIHILWRDNNSDSKGVALRIPYEDYKSPDRNPVCDVECRDEGMLSGLQDYISSQTEGDILIVLHQMGSHGPAYYKRYPVSFERFRPACKTNQLEKCSNNEITNAYDNTVLYTDYFLSKVINFLKPYSARFETAMVYMSDHGESLGENGLYLHGLPYFIAPESQRHIATVMWFGESFKIDKKALKDRSKKPYSHDNLFHTLLGLMEANTSVYNKDMDIIHQKFPAGNNKTGP